VRLLHVLLQRLRAAEVALAKRALCGIPHCVVEHVRGELFLSFERQRTLFASILIHMALGDN